MGHHLRLVFVVCAALGVAAPTAAQGWGRGWFEKWSGPGAFYGTDVRLGVGCMPVSEARFDPPWNGRNASPEERAALCLDAEFSFYANEDNDRAKHGFISFDRYQLLAMYILPQERLRGALELGAGVGSIAFHGSAFEFDRTFVPLRATLKPLRIATRSDDPRRPVLGIVQVVGTLLVFPETVRHQDFNIVPAADEESFSHHFHPNITVMLDFSSFLFNR
jgi:hypothetical protein